MGSVGTGKISSSTIDKTPFTKMGNGQWEFDIPGVGGASILDESDSSSGGFGAMSVYSVKVWDKDYNEIERYNLSTLNAAKAMAKDALKRQG